MTRPVALSTTARCYLFAPNGDHPKILDWTERFHVEARAAGRHTQHVVTEGGHTFATWQAQLSQALTFTLADDAPPSR